MYCDTLTIGNPLSSVYSASKFALEGYSDTLRRELAHFGISVSVVEPAYVSTEIFEKSALKAEFAKQITAVPSEVKALYPFFHGETAEAKRIKQIERADPPTVTTAAIHSAISAVSPKTRYVVANVSGMPAWIVAYLVKYLPDRVVDFLFNVI
jgi:NAD(P)-dependent dehydrogenase (short-subunit alcohol dehydrogenase family)